MLLTGKVVFTRATTASRQVHLLTHTPDPMSPNTVKNNLVKQTTSTAT